MEQSFLEVVLSAISSTVGDEPIAVQLVTIAIAFAVILVIMAVYILLFLVFMKLNKRIFRKIRAKKGNSITLQFMEKAVSVVLAMVFIVIPLGGGKIAQSLLGSTAVIAVVVGLAANEVLKDMFAGLEISIYKPFDVGDRIMLEDGRAGIIEKLTLRHVVICLLDTTRLIIPNNRANSMHIINFSYDNKVPRSIEVRYPISYGSDIDKAKEVIRKTICECPLTLNEDKYNPDDPNSKSVYFLKLEESSLIMGATIYYPHNIRTEVVVDEVNTRIFKALEENGIEIPYNYLNVVLKEKSV
ncbi:mechanosensitive ion channel family protein [Butyrivibrio sp. MC2021]|uniref:mechanosensitive ion channel family protein n=1 Tax=Butyrivibrio sp. MC2021 TaxID=1408306 RepID=UPI00047BC1D5|nr:mechanosensitive ion channel family protein [Butyrivibrio sp. MC2021]